jgi:hypothetical protein
MRRDSGRIGPPDTAVSALPALAAQGVDAGEIRWADTSLVQGGGDERTGNPKGAQRQEIRPVPYPASGKDASVRRGLSEPCQALQVRPLAASDP